MLILSFLPLAVYVLAVFLHIPAVVAQGGFGFDEPKFCPPYRCPKGQEPVPKWPLGLKGMGCTSMGGGMQLMAPGSQQNEAHEACCDLRQACMQLCGSMKAYCDAEFTKCTAAACEDVSEEDEKKQCEQSSNLHGIMLKLDQCTTYDNFQTTNCDCVDKGTVNEARERVLRAFYKKFYPENVGNAASLAVKADTPTKFVGLLLKLVKKYPAAIKKVKDPQQEYMEKIMRDAKREESRKADGSDVEGDDPSVEDLGTEEL